MEINWPPVMEPIERLEVRLLSLPTRASLAASHDDSPPADRELVVVKAIDGDDYWGWGECSALNRDTYSSETARSSFDALRRLRLGEPPDQDRSAPMAAAAVEMAALDLWLKSTAGSMGELYGFEQSSTIKAGAVVGLGPIPDVLAQVGELVEQGFERVKLKITPGHDVDVVHSVRLQWPELELQVDANGAYPPSGVATMYRIKALGVNVFEQPFDWRTNDVAAIRKLKATGALVVADESIHSEDTLTWYYEAGAASAISIKPGRLGGIGATKSMMILARNYGVEMAVGGMLESGLGRHSLAQVASDALVTITGDVSPARRWLAEDPWPDIKMFGSTITVPKLHGVAPDPDEEMIERFTVDRAVVEQGNPSPDITHHRT